ncbi:hypothetical protein [Solibacillus isronensis]|uniref:hypothetical protein n=1 Tax=Solibacillus isronensis TaxID=412383 RepID=UPI00335F956B
MIRMEIFLSIGGIVLSFLMFVLSMVYVGDFPMLTITGILGLSGVSFFVYRIVSRWIH